MPEASTWRNSTWNSESPLHESLALARGAGGSRWGYFLRRETMHGLFTCLGGEAASDRTKDPDFHTLSHGESFLARLSSDRFNGDGFVVMDEPEADLAVVDHYVRYLGAPERYLRHLVD